MQRHADVVYTLGSNPAEQKRLRRQSTDLSAHAEFLFDRAGLRAGQRVLDLGCGPSGVLDLLSERVGPSGEVVGLDTNPEHVALARAFAAERGLNNVSVFEGDARHTGLLPESFDVVHARLVLVNIPDPELVVAEMVRLVKPGGWVLGDEADTLMLCEPAHPALDRLSDAFKRCYSGDGADPHLGRRLPGLYREAGLDPVGVEVRADTHPCGHPRRPILLDLIRSMRDKVIDRGLIGHTEFDDLDRQGRAHLDDPAVVVIPCLYFLAWGQLPA